MLYIDCALALQLHIENGKILNTNEQKYLMLNKSYLFIYLFNFAHKGRVTATAYADK